MDRPLRVAICDDDPKELALLLSHITESTIITECEAFTRGKDLLASHGAQCYDLVFLDIYMNGMLGTEVASRIRSVDSGVTLVFTTTSKEHALEGYRLKASAYLEKPINPQEVGEVLELAANKRENAPAISLLIEGKCQRIPLDRILYFEVRNHAVFVNTLSGTLKTSQTVKLKDIEAALPENFVRCHHSYIANLDYVCQIDADLKTFSMQNGDRVYIRYTGFRKAAAAYENSLLAKARRRGL